MTLETVTAHDLSEMLDEVGHLVTKQISPLRERPEEPITPAQLSAVTDACTSLGLLDRAGDGLGLWGIRPGLQAFSVAALRRIAAVDGGIAVYLHRLAVLERLRHRLSLPEARGTQPPAGAVSLQGHWGFGRQPLARLLAGRPLSESDRALLLDYFDPVNHDRVVLGGATPALLLAAYDGTAVTWHLVDPGDCDITRQPNAHGLDVVPVSTVGLHGLPPPVRQDTSLLAEALFLDSLGLMAIAAGLVDHASALAGEYARLRWQGGALIKDHPAVQQMLANLVSARQQASLTLAAFSESDAVAATSPTLRASSSAGPRSASPVTARARRANPARSDAPSASPVSAGAYAAAYAKLAAARAPYHPLCCDAVNQAMQVFGGIGYMRDVGIERLVRDANCLRVMSGTPGELELFVAAWENP